jgi:MFS family permease
VQYLRLEPLRQTTFRRIWIASLFCNSAQHIQAVAAAWLMVQLTADPGRVALVQTASMVPLMLLALPGGALADIYDRRKSALAALVLTFAGAVSLSIFSALDRLTPTIILTGCFLSGTGVALFTPAWAASVIELVGAQDLRSGVALNSMSNNIARSIGPAAGGFAVMSFGVAATFGFNLLLYAPMFWALYSWQRAPSVRMLPPENFGRASILGLRYAAFFLPVRSVLFRTAMLSIAVSAVYALLPLVARSTLLGDSAVYGILVGAFGLGAVVATLVGVRSRAALTPETSVRLLAVAQGSALGVLALSRLTWVSCVALFVVGACWIRNNATLNVSIQMSAPRWVSARLLALFYAAIAGGLGVGSWVWGQLASHMGIEASLVCAGGVLLASILLGMMMPLPPLAETETISVPATTSPEVSIDLEGRSGPIVLEIAYRVGAEQLDEFRELLRHIRGSRLRNGAYGISLARDIADPELWTERCYYPTWHEYVRARERPTKTERDLQARMNALSQRPEDVRVRRLLELPYGSASESEGFEFG